MSIYKVCIGRESRLSVVYKKFGVFRTQQQSGGGCCSELSLLCDQTCRVSRCNLVQPPFPAPSVKHPRPFLALFLRLLCHFFFVFSFFISCNVPRHTHQSLSLLGSLQIWASNAPNQACACPTNRFSALVQIARTLRLHVCCHAKRR